jgi:hypothetical protein
MALDGPDHRPVPVAKGGDLGPFLRIPSVAKGGDLGLPPKPPGQRPGYNLPPCSQGRRPWPLPLASPL